MRDDVADLEQAGVWLAGHGLEAGPSAGLVAVRLAVRRRARLASSVLLAGFLIAVALVYTAAITVGDPASPLALVFLALTVAALVTGQSLLDRWVRRADRRAGAALPRRVAHPVRLGWRAVLGVPRAAFAAATFAAALVLGVASLTVPDPGARFAAVMLLVALAGVAVGTLVQLRHVLSHPAVADDEMSLTADVVMRVEDARELATPTVVWCLPVVSVFATTPLWWSAAWLGFVVLSVVALALVHARTPGSGAAARYATGAA